MARGSALLGRCAQSALAAEILTSQPFGSAASISFASPPFPPFFPLSFLGLGTAPGTAASRDSATMYTLPVAGSRALTYSNSGFTQSARLLGSVLQSKPAHVSDASYMTSKVMPRQSSLRMARPHRLFLSTRIKRTMEWLSRQSCVCRPDRCQERKPPAKVSTMT